ncbi:hypothetical protein SAMN05421684_3087 [Asanoa ishikariensis]|uniref:Uncharacterized protein n=1 Tax=Asanoa ishikariensis TaxID=137265 RepID=A0A1H3QQ42_9ACTN|nr:hypothetical protein SAMN05421684_3087 [Asanoa ishikariensis]
MAESRGALKVCQVAVTPQERTGSTTDLRVTLGEITYPAVEIARGAAYELFSTDRGEGFEPDTRPGARHPFHRYAHVTEVTAVNGRPADPHHPDRAHHDGPEEPDDPLTLPLSRAVGWREIHTRSQNPAAAGDPILMSLRASAHIRRGTRMVKHLSAQQVAAYLRGRLPHGFCYREYDVAHLRTPADLTLLRTEADNGRDREDIAFALRWRAVDPSDFDLPSYDRYPGLVTMPAHDRMGAPVLGTGFAPSGRHVIPEFVTSNFTDLPMPAGATLVAYTADGDEAMLYTFQPEQRGWLRMAGPRWRPLLSELPGIPPDQEYVQLGDQQSAVHLVGTYRGEECVAVADPPGEFRVLAMTRAARYPVETLARRNEYGRWRDSPCLVLRQESGWLRLRLCRPDPEAVARLGAQCYERGVYETWAPLSEVTDRQIVDNRYEI